MRTLGEIIESAKKGNKPSWDECYWAMLALDALHNFDSRALRNLAYKEKNPPNFSKLQADESFRRCKAALAKSPKDWVGRNNDPANPEYQKRRNIALKLFDKFCEKPQ